MSTRSATANAPRAASRSRSRAAVAAAERRRARARRRRGVTMLAVLLALLAAIPLVAPLFNHAVREITLPLRHEDIIRQQAREKGLDPALIAAVIYAESHFRDGQTSHADALSLMQITPE